MSTDTDYAVYEGPIGDFTAHVPILCSAGGSAAATITPSDGNTYYLVVPNDHYYEGRYGSGELGGGDPSRADALLSRGRDDRMPVRHQGRPAVPLASHGAPRHWASITLVKLRSLSVTLGMRKGNESTERRPVALDFPA